MEWVGLAVYLIAAGLVLGQAALMLVQTWEHQRFARSRARDLTSREPPSGRAAIFVPCKGNDLGLEENLRALLVQAYDDYEVTFVVEIADDPACATIRRLMTESRRVPVRLVVAGQATASGQKVHNLQAAAASISPEIAYLAFADSDARPHRLWLRALVQRLDRPGVGAVTGYRWFVPDRPSLVNLVLYSINCGVALWFGPGNHHLVWGGSWAVRREVFDAIRMCRRWENTLSDDLVVSRVLREHGLGVGFQPPCMVASPLDFSLRTACGFIRRQYMISRFYARRYWLLAISSATVVNLTMWTSVLWAAWGLLGRSPWGWVGAAVAATHYILSIVRAGVRQHMAAEIFPTLRTRLRVARLFDLWAAPLVGAVNWAGLLSSALGREIVWRGIRYRLLPDGHVESIRRDDPAELQAIEPAVGLDPSLPVQSLPIPRRKAG